MADYGATNGVNGYNRQSYDPNTSATGKVTLVSLLRHHLRDWLWIVVMTILELIMYFVVQPFHRFVSESMMANYLYPVKPYTVPTWAVGVCQLITQTSMLIFANGFLELIVLWDEDSPRFTY